ncbi:O-methyltransferase [Micractinium conductrix]|uniref:O-methyltransferase n=1 Tax=Micractinium conductrix TaxID=554055 RepID=A0A2P6V7K6_9CHLO|nr:O-methyltransferase [Micractinium conductrix]|eukprot:PSC70066.1 O-methyltransferase [Micractinium conductrix]
MGLKTGAELGVQRGNFARRTLEFWPSCESYTLVDVWKQQVNYQEAANVDDTMQEQLYQTAIRTLQPFQNKTKFMRMFTSEAAPLVPNESLDYIYVDARHDYCGCLEDIENWWPKVKPGGIMAGHDYLDAKEVLVHRPNEDWALCMNGTRNEGAVKGAVADFSVRHGLTPHIASRPETPPTA